MLIVETIGRIRREHLIKGHSIKEIARDLKISRNTVRKILRSGETSFSYEREVQPRPKLGRWNGLCRGPARLGGGEPAGSRYRQQDDGASGPAWQGRQGPHRDAVGGAAGHPTQLLAIGTPDAMAVPGPQPGKADRCPGPAR